MTLEICCLCVLLLILSIACRALHEFIRHDLEWLCDVNKKKEYFRLVVDNYESVRGGFELLRSFLLFSIPVLITLEVLGIPLDGKDKSIHVEAWQLVNVLPYFFLFVACRYWIARPLGDLWATKIVYHCFPIFRFMAFFMLPLNYFGKFIEIIIFRLADKPQTPQNEEEELEDDILSMVAEGHREGLIDDDVRDMLDRIIRLDDARVSAIMTQRSDVQFIQKDASWQEMLTFVKENQFSRIPVYGENHDDIVGILFIKDLLKDVGEDGTCAVDRWKGMLRAPVYVPETKLVNELLQEFLDTQNHFAIVMDEYGNVAGVVTLEDILEQIVGEIADETDDKPIEEIQSFENGVSEVLGQVSISEVNTQLRTDFPTDGDYDTIGGLILTELGHVPQPGETVEYEGIVLTVLEATACKIEKIQIALGVHGDVNGEKTENNAE
ncbi:MAG: hemolysin family protein [Planctomycetia bacterium]|nr:hemolysin family protein [Planctomycetia bacterium]